jgi:hypothetical protein
MSRASLAASKPHRNEVPGKRVMSTNSNDGGSR